MSNVPIKYYNNHSGGLNRIMSAVKVADNESPLLENIEYTENGLPSKRRGTNLFGNSLNSQVVGIGRLYTSSAKIMLRISGTAMQRYTAGTWADVSGKTYTLGALTNFAQVRGSVYTHDGTNSMGKYDGTTLSTPSYGITASFGITYNDVHVASGNSSNPSRLYFSSSKNSDNFIGLSGTATAGAASTLTDSGKTWDTNEFQSLNIQITAGTGAGQIRTISSNTATVITVSVAWTTTPDTTSQYIIEGGDTLDVSKDDGQAVTGLAKFEDKLIVFKESSWFQITFDDSGLPIVQYGGSYGAVGHRSIESVENDIWFLSRDGVRSLGYVQNIPGVIRTNVISAKIEPEIMNINPNQFRRASAHYFEYSYILSFPQGSSVTNNRIAVLNARYGNWSIWTGMSANCFLAFIDSSDNSEKLYFGDDDSGQVYEMFSTDYTDGASTAISADYYTKQFDLGAFDVRKNFPFIDIQLRSLTGTLNIDIIIDGATIAKTASLSSTFTSKDGIRIFMYREAMYREDLGSTTSVVTVDDPRRILLNTYSAIGRTIQVRVYNSTAGETFTLMGIGVGVRAYSARNFPAAKTIF